MNYIENTYMSYDDLMESEGEEVIQKRISQINKEMDVFIRENNLFDIAIINQVSLTHAILDYFTDIQRLKSFHKIEHVNEVKIKAYETFWLLQRSGKTKGLKKVENEYIILFSR